METLQVGQKIQVVNILPLNNIMLPPKTCIRTGNHFFRYYSSIGLTSRNDNDWCFLEQHVRPVGQFIITKVK